MSIHSEDLPASEQVSHLRTPETARDIAAIAFTLQGSEPVEPNADMLREAIPVTLFYDQQIETIVRLQPYQRERFVAWLGEIGVNEPGFNYAERQRRLAPLTLLLQGHLPEAVADGLGLDGVAGVKESITNVEKALTKPNRNTIVASLAAAQELQPVPDFRESIDPETSPNVPLLWSLKRKLNLEEFTFDDRSFSLEASDPQRLRVIYDELGRVLEGVDLVTLPNDLQPIFEVFGDRMKQMLAMYRLGYSQQGAREWLIHSGAIKQRIDFEKYLQGGMERIFTLKIGRPRQEPSKPEGHIPQPEHKLGWQRYSTEAYFPPSTTKDALTQVVALAVGGKEYDQHLNDEGVDHLATQLAEYMLGETAFEPKDISSEMLTALALMKAAYIKIVSAKQQAKESEPEMRYKIMSSLLGNVVQLRSKRAINEMIAGRLRQEIIRAGGNRKSYGSVLAVRIQNTDREVLAATQEIVAYLKYTRDV